MKNNDIDYLKEAKKIVDTAIKDIETMIEKDIAHYSAFILCSCVIDYLAGYRYEDEYESCRKKMKNGEKYKKFVSEYLQKTDSRYSPENLWEYLRCGFVHSFTTKKDGKSKYYFSHKEPHNHLKAGKITDGGSRTLLNLESFIEDIKKAKELYFSDVVTSDSLHRKLIERVKQTGIYRTDLKIDFGG